MKLIFRAHALQRMFERGVDVEEVRTVISNGEIVEDYPNDSPYPSRLVLGMAAGRPLHVVVAYNEMDEQTIIITVYEPSSSEWEADLRTRKS